MKVSSLDKCLLNPCVCKSYLFLLLVAYEERTVKTDQVISPFLEYKKGIINNWSRMKNVEISKKT